MKHRIKEDFYFKIMGGADKEKKIIEKLKKCRKMGNDVFSCFSCWRAGRIGQGLLFPRSNGHP